MTQSCTSGPGGGKVSGKEALSIPGESVSTLFCSVVNLNSIIQAGRKARKSTYLSGISNTKTDSQRQISSALYCKRLESSDFPLPSFLPLLVVMGTSFPWLIISCSSEKKLLLWDPRVSRGTFFTAHGVIHRGNFFQMIFAWSGFQWIEKGKDVNEARSPWRWVQV